MLLQRDDYAVRYLELDEGGQVCTVEVRRFSALNIDVDAYHQGNCNVGTHIVDMIEESVVVGGIRRGAAATTAAMGRKSNHRSDFVLFLVTQGRNAARASLCLRVTNAII